MARTQLQSEQVGDGSISRADLNTTVAGGAVIAKVLAGSGITLAHTGVDGGTGDVTITATPRLISQYISLRAF